MDVHIVHGVTHEAISVGVSSGVKRAEGVQPQTIMETLWHSEIKVTMNSYSHVSAEPKQEPTNRMDALLASPSKG